MESPGTVIVPTIVDNESHRRNAVTLIEILLPYTNHVHDVLRRKVGVLAAGRSIVAVDVEFVPGVVVREGTPRHSTFTFRISEERATLLRFVNILVGFSTILRNETNHGTHFPGFALGQCGVAAPTALNAHHVCIHHNAFFGSVNLSGELAGGIDTFRLVFHNGANGEYTIVGSNESKGIVAVLRTGIATVIIAGGDGALGVNQISSGKVQAVRSTGVLHFHNHFLIFLQLYARLHIGIDIGIVHTHGFNNASGHVGLCHLFPRVGCERNSIVCVRQVPAVFFTCCTSHGVVSRRCFEAGKDAVAHKHCTARVAHHRGGGTGCTGIYVVYHRNDVEHIHIINAFQVHFSAEIVASVAQHGTPSDVHFAAFVGVFVVCNDLFSGKVLSTANGRGIGLQILHCHILERHARSRNVGSCAKSHSENFCTCHQIHGIRTGKIDSVAQFHKAGSQHIVAQCPNAVHLFTFGRTHGFLLRGINHSIGIGLTIGLCGECGKIDLNRAFGIIDGNCGKLALGSHHRHIALLQRALTGVSITISIRITTNLYGVATRNADGIGALFDDHFSKCPAASCI